MLIHKNFILFRFSNTFHISWIFYKKRWLGLKSSWFKVHFLHHKVPTVTAEIFSNAKEFIGYVLTLVSNFCLLNDEDLFFPLLCFLCFTDWQNNVHQNALFIYTDFDLTLNLNQQLLKFCSHTKPRTAWLSCSHMKKGLFFFNLSLILS